MERNFKVAVKVWGDYACFTRPEMKVERVSYDVMTPSAARGVLQAILWKPEFYWIVHEIRVLKPIKRASILRNEVTSKASFSTTKRWSTHGGGYSAEEDRAQRHSLILKDVSYLIVAEAIPKEKSPDLFQKYYEQFTRRVAKGQCLWMPYLGCREFSCFFGPPDSTDIPMEYTMDLGRMLFDMIFIKRGKRRGEGSPIFFDASIKNGVLNIPTELYLRTI